MAIDHPLPPGETQPSAARIAAARVLLALEKGEIDDAADATDHQIALLAMDTRDARLATALVFNSLRNQRLLDFQYRTFLTQSPSRLTPELRVLLRMAAVQRFFFDRIPSHAIANETIQVGRRILKLRPREVGFLNAVIRNIMEMQELRRPRGKPLVERLGILHSQPDWVVSMFLNKFGEEATQSLLNQCNEEPRATIRANTLRVTANELVCRLEAAGTSATRGAIAPDAVVLGDAAHFPQLLAGEEFAAGMFYVQDEASQLVAHIARPAAGERILDLCAAPGGKCTHCAELAHGKAQIDATDISVSRLQIVRENVERLGSPGVQVVDHAEVIDASHKLSRQYDLVLVDAPCSGLGTIRRNPEIRYKCSEPGLERFAARQTELLVTAARLLGRRGRIVYSTCSVSDAENAHVVRQFLETHTDFTIASEPHPNRKIERLRSTDGFFRTWPQHAEMDGFEAAVLIRK